jgi:hypothetical protein
MKISKCKKEKICEQILLFLYVQSPKLLFTSQIAQEIARDEEFVKNLLNEMKSKSLLNKIIKNPKGVAYKRRARWNLSDQVYFLFKEKQKIDKIELTS